MQLLLVWLMSAAALLLTAYFIPGFEMRDFGIALVAALVLGLASAVIWPVLLLMYVPVTPLALGIATLFVSALLLKLTAKLVSGFNIEGWLPAFVGAVAMAFVSMVLGTLVEAL